ncbi:hypothetical protein WICPIJ_007040 [Wickerhamomyces pijperi]|uniref:Uncharacterized protein n=1 Tax=Wickerhamomyces pijperi TaxID=599730 RepID=A0A9P8TKF6_WICPI|nr:hypothetical protein WICPIJ_007040 [Wickerhamomyces pijperi]
MALAEEEQRPVPNVRNINCGNVALNGVRAYEQMADMAVDHAVCFVCTLNGMCSVCSFKSDVVLIGVVTVETGETSSVQERALASLAEGSPAELLTFRNLGLVKLDKNSIGAESNDLCVLEL